MRLPAKKNLFRLIKIHGQGRFRAVSPRRIYQLASMCGNPYSVKNLLNCGGNFLFSLQSLSDTISVKPHWKRKKHVGR